MDYSRGLEVAGQQLQRPITKQEALAYGFSSQILADIVSRITLREEARQLGMGVSDEAIRQSVVADPAFRGANGQYDPGTLERRLYQMRMTKDMFVAERRDELMRQQVIDALVGGVKPSRTMLEVLNRFTNEERVIRFITLNRTVLGEIADPSADELKTFFDERKAAFKTPELRKLQLITVDPKTISRPDDISDQDARSVYDRNAGNYTIPERRRVQQVPFDSKDAADAAVKRLSEGTSFDALIAEMKLKPEDIDQGLLERKGYLDPVVADAVFKLAKPGDSTGAIIGKFRPVVIRLLEVTPEAKVEFDVAKPAIKASLAASRADAAVKTVLKQIEAARDERAGFADIAKRFNLTLTTIDSIDKDGRDGQGKPVEGIPEPEKLGKASFDTDVGNQNDPLPLGSGGFLFFDVTEIKAPRDRTLDEVKDELVRRWKDEQADTRLTQKAAELVARLEKGEALDEVAKSVKLEPVTSAAFTRSGSQSGLSGAVVAAAFNGVEGAAAAARAENDDRIVLQVKEITEPVFFAEADTLKQPASQLDQQMKISLESEYLRQVQTQIGIRVNQPIVSQIIGQPRPN